MLYTSFTSARMTGHVKTCKQSGYEMMDCPNTINFDKEISGEEDHE